MHCNGVLDDVEFSTETSEILLQPFCSGCGLKQQSRGGRQRGDAGETLRRAAPGLCASQANTRHCLLELFSKFPHQKTGLVDYFAFQLTLDFTLPALTLWRDFETRLGDSKHQNMLRCNLSSTLFWPQIVWRKVMNEDLFILSEVQVLECSASEFVGLVQVQVEVKLCTSTNGQIRRSYRSRRCPDHCSICSCYLLGRVFNGITMKWKFLT